MMDNWVRGKRAGNFNMGKLHGELRDGKFPNNKGEKWK